MRTVCCLVFLLPISCFGQNSLERGVQHFKSQQYAEAANDFREAVATEPNNLKAHLYLGRALQMQFVPIDNTTSNLQFATEALKEFQKVLDLDSTNVPALSSIASLYNKQKNFVEAAEWNKRVIAADPNNKEAYYALGVIAWATWVPVDRKARNDSGQKPEDSGPIANPQLRESLKSTWLPILDEGVENMQHALRISPDYLNALLYMNLLIRYRADLDDSPERWSADTTTADMWMQRALAAKNQQPPARMVPPAETPSRFPGGVLGGVIGSLPASSVQAQHGEIRVGANVAQTNLITKVAPVYPPLARQARIQGVVRFNAFIGRDGHIQNLTLISGHPLLVAAARDAVQQWIYKPTLLNGELVNVLTTINVTFSLVQ